MVRCSAAHDLDAGASGGNGRASNHAQRPRRSPNGLRWSVSEFAIPWCVVRGSPPQRRQLRRQHGARRAPHHEGRWRLRARSFGRRNLSSLVDTSIASKLNALCPEVITTYSPKSIDLLRHSISGSANLIASFTRQRPSILRRPRPMRALRRNRRHPASACALAGARSTPAARPTWVASIGT
jgi:hypothetical protein